MQFQMATKIPTLKICAFRNFYLSMRACRFARSDPPIMDFFLCVLNYPKSSFLGYRLINRRRKGDFHFGWDSPAVKGFNFFRIFLPGGKSQPKLKVHLPTAVLVGGYLFQNGAAAKLKNAQH